MSGEPPTDDEDLARLRHKARDQEAEISRLRGEVADARDERARLRADARDARRRQDEWSALVGRLRTEAQAHEQQLAELRDRLVDVEVELDDLRAVRDALAPSELPRRPGLDLAASFLPANRSRQRRLLPRRGGPARRLRARGRRCGGKGLVRGASSRVRANRLRDDGAVLRGSGPSAQLGKRLLGRARRGRP